MKKIMHLLPVAAFMALAATAAPAAAEDYPARPVHIIGQARPPS